MWFSKKFKAWTEEHADQAGYLRDFGAYEEDLVSIRIQRFPIPIGSVDRLLRASGLAARSFLENVDPTSVAYWQTTFAQKLSGFDVCRKTLPCVQRALQGRPLLLSDLEQIAYHHPVNFDDMVLYTEYEHHVRSLADIYIRTYPDNDQITDMIRYKNDAHTQNYVPFLRKFEDYLFESGRFSEWNSVMSDGLKHVMRDKVTTAANAKKMMVFAGWDESDLRDVRRDSIDFSVIAARVEKEKGVGIHEVPLPELFRMSRSKVGIRY